MSNEALTLLISVLALTASVVSLAVTILVAARQARQHYLIEGAQAAIEWRTQVFDLHDRGLNPAQIRRIMLLEDAGDGYEASNGRIDDILKDLPRRV